MVTKSRMLANTEGPLFRNSRVIGRRFKLAQETFIDDYKQSHQRYIFGVQNYRIWKRDDPAPIDGRFTYAVSKSVKQTGEIIGMTTPPAVS